MNRFDLQQAAHHQRDFEAVRRHIEGRVYASLPEKYGAVHAFLADLDADPERIRSLASWH